MNERHSYFNVNWLARQVAASYPENTSWFDLEDPADLARLDDPGLELRPLRGMVVLDEFQRLPNVFPLLRVLADRPSTPARFLVLGSASPDLQRLWLRGGFPRSYLAESDSASRRWRTNFIDSFLSRDVRDFGVSLPTATLRRFWIMLAHWQGQIWNGAEFGRAFGVSHTTVRRYLDLLNSLFVVRQYSPWFENIGKRQVRSPKVHIADSGILHTLLGLGGREEVLSHPKACFRNTRASRSPAGLSPEATP